jgi:TatD DNase family protein
MTAESFIAPSADVPRYVDAHNHLQDVRFADHRETIVREAIQAGVTRMVVNGSCEEDWPTVAELAERYPSLIIPAFGYHPWYIGERTAHWKTTLVSWLDRFPHAVIGEIGIDQWILDQSPERLARAAPAMVTPPPPMSDQESVFVWQLKLASERNLSASVHCLAAFGKLQRLLETHGTSRRGFLLHSYGGPLELVKPFIQLGARFSFSGYFAHERKQARRDVFAKIPLERLLVETDAPDQLPPAPQIGHSLQATDGTPLNHPANLPRIYQYLATLRADPLPTLAKTTLENFHLLFS